MNTHKNYSKNVKSNSTDPKKDIELFDYARAFNVVGEKPEFEEIIDNACLAKEHTSQIIEADRNDLTHTKTCLQKEKNILTAINGINPNDTVESMLASQMITTHNAAMKAFAKAESYNMREAHQFKKLAIASASLGNKLMRTYTMQSTVNNICGAKTRSGKPCPTTPVKNRSRCRMHGGTNNGAPKGNKNAFKHGYYSKASIAQRSETHKLIREYRKLCRELNEL